MEAMMFPFGWSQYLQGGLLIGLGVGLLFVLTGLIGGMSTVYSSTWSYALRLPFFQQPSLLRDRAWRLAYAAGLIIGAALWWTLTKQTTRVSVPIPPAQLFAGGLLVGYGARLSKGCTSGHGICGLASLSRPSFVAVCTFLATACVTANIVAHFTLHFTAQGS
jgi:uncharacterized membrane protein YedE/YeeE